MPQSILLTGASGVVGTELVKLFPEEDLILGRHRAQPESGARQIAIDIRAPHLGLNKTEYSRLADEITSIVHAAAVTDMGAAAEGLEETNINGVKNILTLATDAEVPLHYVSTAYCTEDFGPKRTSRSAYIESKRAAETLVENSGLDWTIIRPSIVVGHSKTGQIATFQGFHLFVGSMLRGRLPLIPLDPSDRCDFVPADLIAKGIIKIVRTPQYGHAYWLTAGNTALTIEEMIEAGQPFAKTIGKDLSNLILADPETAEKVHLPGLKERLPRRLKERLHVMMELSSVMATAEPFPTDIPKLVQDIPMTHGFHTDVLRANIRHWGSENRYDFNGL
ncbi:MAG: SDR family oxidoreductase [Pseudomonadota bacterium]